MATCTITWARKDGVLTIRIQGTFHFAAQKAFRDAYEQASPETTHIVVDVEGVEHVDSSALGMLVLMKKTADENGIPVSIVNSDAHLRRLFATAHLDSVIRIA